MHEDGKDKYVDEALGELPVIERSHSGNKAEHGGESGTRAASRRRINGRWSIRSSSGNGSFKARSEAVLAVDHAADITLAALAKRLSTSTAVGGCHLVCVNG